MAQNQVSPEEQEMNRILYGEQSSAASSPAAPVAAAPVASPSSAAVPVGSEDQEMNRILHGDGAGTGAGMGAGGPEKESKVNQLVNEVAGPGTYLGEIAEGEYNIGAGVKKMVQGDVIGGAKQAVGDLSGAKRMLNATASRGSEQIDIQKHPILKAGLEFAEGMTSPVNLGLVIASGGLGMVDSAAKIFMVHQLANAGLTSQQIVDMYNRFPEVKKAWDAGDSSKVLYEGTHLLLSGVLTAAGMLDMAGKPMEAVGERPRAAAQAAAQAVGTVAGKAAEAVGTAAGKVAKVPGRVAGKVKGKLAAPEAEVVSNPVEDLATAFPPSKTNPYDVEKAPQVAYNALAAEHKLNTIHDPTEAAAAMQEQISKAENKVMEGAIQQVPNEPIIKNSKPVSVWNEVKSELESRKIEREGFVDDAMKELEKYGFRQDKPTTVADADRIRRQLNDETTAIEKKPDYQQVRIENVDPKYAALQYAKDVLRDGVYDTVDAHGLDKGVTARDFRRDIIGNMISFRNAMLDKAYASDQPVKGTAPEAPKESLTRRVARGVAPVAGAIAGAKTTGALGAAAGAYLGKEIGERVLPSPEVPEDLTRSQLLDRALNHPEADKFVTETPEEQQIRGRIQKPATTPAKGQTEVPFGPPELFGENQGEVTPMEMRPEQLSKITAYIAKLREALENPTATAVEKDAAQHQIEKIFGGKIPEGFKRPKEQGVVNPTPKLLEASQFEEPWQVRTASGMDIKAILNHELAHAALAHAAGFKPVEIISHDHEDAGPKTVAAARIEWPADMAKTPTGSIEPRGLREHLPDILAISAAGGIANELYDGVKWEDNKHLGADLKDINDTLDLLGLSAEEKDRFIEWGKTKAKAVLQDSDVENLINEFSDTRERGLPSTHHYSVARINEFRDRLDQLRGKNAINPERLNVSSKEHGAAGVTDRTRTLEASSATETPARESKVTWPERTTGVHDTAIREGGAVPGGIQKGDPEIGLKDLVLFHDPQSGSTLALPVDRVTKENVVTELEKSREMYRQAEIRKREQLRQAIVERLKGKS